MRPRITLLALRRADLSLSSRQSSFRPFSTTQSCCEDDNANRSEQPPPPPPPPSSPFSQTRPSFASQTPSPRPQQPYSPGRTAASASYAPTTFAPSPPPNPLAGLPGINSGPPPPLGSASSPSSSQKPSERSDEVPLSFRQKELRLTRLAFLETYKERLNQRQTNAKDHLRMAGTREAAARARAKTDREVAARFQNEELLSMQPLRFRDGDCYSPHDLTPAEQRHYMFGGKEKVQERDLVAVAGINPLDCYRNFTLIRSWTTKAGRILHGSETGYSPRNQRKVAKAVRRAIGLGLYPSTHAHPEQLSKTLFPINDGRMRIPPKK